MAKTLQTMVTRIASEIRRPLLATPADMTSPIVLAILDAINICQKDRFRISDIDPAFAERFFTVVGQSVYDSVSNNFNIGTIFQVDYLNVLVGSTMAKMTKRTPEEIHLLNQQNQQSGQPTDWAYEGNKFIIYPLPSQIWTVFIGGHIVVLPPAALDEDNNPWMNWAEQLIRCHAKYLIAVNVTRNAEMAQQFSPDADGGPNGKPGETWRAWRRLKNETNKIKSTGRVRAMQW
jgi:hypothetical protein